MTEAPISAPTRIATPAEDFMLAARLASVRKLNRPTAGAPALKRTPAKRHVALVSRHAA